MTHLRKMMLEELQRRNYSDRTAHGYVRAVAAFAAHFGKAPDKLGPDDLRSYQAYLLQERKLAVGTVIARVAALRFFFVRTLKRHEFRQDLPYPKKQRRLPTVLSLEEVARLIDAAGNLLQRTHCRRGLCVFATSDSWPIGSEPIGSRSAANSSTLFLKRRHLARQTPPLPGAAPAVAP